MRTYRGSCHCGAVAFEVDAPAALTVHDCNCSICRRGGFLHLIVPRDRFRLLSGAEHLILYKFNTGVARHTFCGICGVKPFYTPRSDPEDVSINVRCLEGVDLSAITILPFDGVHWEASMAGRTGLMDSGSG
jgi:hypothetical protein